MKLHSCILLLLIFSACNTGNKKTFQEDEKQTFYVGTYTNGDSHGIYKYALRDDGMLEKIGLAAKDENPSYLATSADNKYLVAVNEVDNNNQGSIESFRIDGDSLILVNQSITGGAHPCFVSRNEDGFILAANYTGGNVGLLKLNQKGELSSLLDVEQHVGQGITDRQKGPHAHSAWFSPFDNTVISVDLGTNQLWFSKLDAKLQKLVPSHPQKLTMEPGAGPRHLAFHPNGKWIYVVNELNCTVTHIEKSETGSFTKGSSISTLPANFDEPNTCADIKVSSDGKFVYVSNRGHNSIVIYSINSDGSLNLLGHENTRGNGPRNFSLSSDEKYLVVANQHTNNLISFKRDIATGLLSFVSEIEAPSPVCILF